MAITVTNQEFLQALFGAKWERTPISWGKDSWSVKPAGKYLAKRVVEDSNYFTVSIFALMASGHFARRKELFEQQFVFVVDDVGTKLNEALLRPLLPAPTYVLETSPGNFQWGFKLLDGFDHRAIAALVYRIIRDKAINPKLRDPGMVGVTRVARLPVGSNNKEAIVAANGGKGWPHVMHVWEPERAYKVAEIAGVMGVELTEETLHEFREVGGTRKATAAEIGDDPIMKLFDKLGMIRDPEPNDNGFVVIQCPWHAEHSDSRDEAGYKPGSGGFQCHHGHCEQRNMNDLRGWFEKNVSDEDRAEALGETFGDVDPDDPALKREAAQGRARAKEQAEAVLKVIGDWVFIVSMHRFGCISKNLILPENTFNSESLLAPYGKSGDKSAAAIFLNNPNTIRCKTATYEPGKDPVYKDPEDGEYVFNTWRPGAINPHPFDVAAEDIKPWLDHVAFILPDETAREQFLKWCAFLVQYPGQKMNWAFLLVGPQGVGKDIMLRPLYGILGRENFTAISSEDFDNGWTDWAERQLVIVEELPSFHKKDVYDKLKRYTAEGVPYFRVNKKRIPIYHVRNMQNWFIMSNHEDAMALEIDDRRYFVYATPATKRAPDYYAPLVNETNGLFKDPIFQGKVWEWLLRYDLSKFNPGEAPPVTQAKINMTEETRHPVDRYLHDDFDEGGKYANRKLVQTREILSDVQALHKFGGVSPDVVKVINETRVGRWFRKSGWRALRARFASGGIVRLWIHPKTSFDLVSKLGPAELERRYLEDVAKAAAGRGGDKKGGPDSLF